MISGGLLSISNHLSYRRTTPPPPGSHLAQCLGECSSEFCQGSSMPSEYHDCRAGPKITFQGETLQKDDTWGCSLLILVSSPWTTNSHHSFLSYNATKLLGPLQASNESGPCSKICYLRPYSRLLPQGLFNQTHFLNISQQTSTTYSLLNQLVLAPWGIPSLALVIHTFL